MGVTWSMHTLAEIHLYGVSSVLSLGGVHLHVRVIEPATAMLSATTVTLQPPQRSSKGLSKLMVNLNVSESSAGIGSNGTSTSMRIVVRLSMDADDSTPRVRPLSEWEVNGPFETR